jgi:hypothetical protein
VLRRNPVGSGARFVPEGGIPEGYSWQLDAGPDFDVYYAQNPTQGDAGVGMYLGRSPNFPESANSPCESGRLLGTEVCWVVMDGSEEKTHAFYRTTLLKHQRTMYHPIYIHIWVFAEDESELQLLMDSLKDLRIRPMQNIFHLVFSRGA